MSRDLRQIYERLRQQAEQSNSQIDEHQLRQKAWVIRDRMVYEAEAISTTSVSSAAAGSGGGKIPSKTLLYSWAEDGYLYRILDKKNGNDPRYSNVSFPGTMTFAKNADDGFVYFINPELDIFGKFDPADPEILIEIPSNITEITNQGCTSFYYEGGGNFIAVDGFKKSGVTNIIRISSVGVATEVSEVDQAIKGYVLMDLFKHEDDVWAFAYADTEESSLTFLGKYDIDAADFIEEPPILTLQGVPGAEVPKPLYVLSVASVDGAVYANIYWDDSVGDASGLGIFKISLETSEATWVRDSETFSDGIIGQSAITLFSL